MASSYRLKRGPVIVLLLVVGVVGAVLLGRGQLRPALDVYDEVVVPEAYAGTTYAVDGAVCLRASGGTASVSSVEEGERTRLGLRPEGAPVTIAFPVAQDALAPLSGLDVAAGDQTCTRLLVTADGRGEQRAEPVRLKVRYGPLGLLRTTMEVTPPVTLQVTGTGTDPRTTAG